MLYAIYFIYGLCVMFYFMMAWLFYRKDKELLSRLVTVLMLVIGMQCLKDLLFIKPIAELDETDWMIITSSDVIAIPLYAFTLIELCSPASLTRRTIIIHELLFIVPLSCSSSPATSSTTMPRYSRLLSMVSAIPSGQLSPSPDIIES